MIVIFICYYVSTSASVADANKKKKKKKKTNVVQIVQSSRRFILVAVLSVSLAELKSFFCRKLPFVNFIPFKKLYFCRPNQRPITMKQH